MYVHSASNFLLHTYTQYLLGLMLHLAALVPQSILKIMGINIVLSNGH